MFGRRRKQQEQEEAAREAERRALFEELAKRPDTICPFLGLENARAEFRDRVSDGHRCYAFGDPAELSAEQQQKVCLQRGYGNCPRYLRGVLVIPTEELEALRRPQPAPPPAPVPPPAPMPAEGGGRRGLIAIAAVLLVAVIGGGGAYLALSGGGGIAQETPTPTASASTTTEPSATPTGQPSGSQPAPTATPIPTPVVLPSTDPSTSAFPTPGPGDQSTGYIVVVRSGDYPVVRMLSDGTIVENTTAQFADISGAPVERLVVDSTRYWRTLAGDYTGLAYSRALSDDFDIYETFENAEGEARFRALEPDEY